MIFPLSYSSSSEFTYSSGHGGAIAALGESTINLKLESADDATSFEGNQGSFGVAIFSQGSTFNIETTEELIDYILFYRNSAYYGGALYCQDGLLNVNGGKFSNNAALGGFQFHYIEESGSYYTISVGGYGGAFNVSS